jgi:hypothetical protein
MIGTAAADCDLASSRVRFEMCPLTRQIDILGMPD